jgi:hypothetical protein
VWIQLPVHADKFPRPSLIVDRGARNESTSESVLPKRMSVQVPHCEAHRHFQKWKGASSYPLKDD